SVVRAGAAAGRRARPSGHGAPHREGVRCLVGSSRPALANILIGDATDPVCESVFRSRGHAVDFKPGMSKEELLAVIGKYDGLVVRSGVTVDEDLIAAASSMRIVGRAGTGTELRIRCN
ncbi:unnamed protein product, partial [Laminaria digitata]